MEVFSKFPYLMIRLRHRHAGTGIFLAFAGALAAFPAHANDGQDGCVGKPGAALAYVDVENIRSDKGQIAITLYPDVPSRFLRSHGSLYVRRVPTQAPVTRICFRIPAPGTYGIAIYHDENANDRLDRSGLLPSEGFGFSNNASTMFGIPSFSSIRIKLADNSQTRIKLRYPRGDELKKRGH